MARPPVLRMPAFQATPRFAAMPERRYREVQSRSQLMLLPPCLDDYVSEHNPVRAINALVGTLDLRATSRVAIDGTFLKANASPGACEVTGNSGLLGLADVGCYRGAKVSVRQR